VFEKLLSLLLHAKGGAVATVFVLGTTGALVTATVDNGLTTITITQPSSTTTGSQTTTGGSTTTNNTVTETILALFTRTNADEDPTGTATGNGCSDEAHKFNEQMRRVNAESQTQRAEAKELGRDAEKDGAAKKDVRALVEEADKAIKEIRKAADKAIHATFDCDKDDEDEDEDEDEDDEDEDDEDNTSTTTTTTTSTTTTTTVAFGGDDAKLIADLAITAMKQEVTDLKAALDLLPTTETIKEDKKSDHEKSDKAKRENKGKGNDKDKGRDSDDEDEEDDD
jgi:hypothetical protein